MQIHKNTNTLVWLCTIIFFSFSVNAQGFFPELNAIPSKKSMEQKTEETAPALDPQEIEAQNTLDLLSAESDDDQDALQVEVQANKPAPEVNVPLVEIQQPLYQPQDPSQTAHLFRIYFDKIDIPASLVPTTTVCMATLTLHNQSSQVLQRFAANLAFDTQSVSISAVNLAPNAKISEQLTLVGNVCQSLFDPPKLSISACQTEGLSEEQCKLKAFFDSPKLSF